MGLSLSSSFDNYQFVSLYVDACPLLEYDEALASGARGEWSFHLRLFVTPANTQILGR
jgi:hypothetical protein